MSFLYLLGGMLMFIPFILLYPTKVLGKKRRVKGKKILVCNHLSITDVFIMGANNRGQVHFLSKREFHDKNRFTKMLVNALGMVPVDRGKPDLVAVKKVFGLLKKNKTIGIFPEGTRNKTDADLLEIKGGSTMFALKSGAPVTPTMLYKKPKLLRRNILIIGDPLRFEEFEGKKVNAEVLDVTGQMLEREMIRLLKMVRLYASLKGKAKRDLRRKLNNPAIRSKDIYNEYFDDGAADAVAENVQARAGAVVD